MATNKIYIPYYISNNTGAPAQVLPRVFFYNGLKDSDPYWIQHWTTSSFGKTIIAEQYSAFPYFDNYSGQVTTTSSLSLLFLNEDPVYGTQTPSQSLYDAYWSKYVDLLYNPRTRIIRLSAVIPFVAYNKLELNDVIQLRSNYYHLRAINDYNLRTGECRMELLGPLLEGSLNNTFTFDNTCEQVPTLYGSVINDTGSRTITFAITGSNCCNNPNYVTVKAQFGTGSCPQTASLTSYVTLPNSNPIVVDYASLLVGYPTVNCVTMSVANLCYGLGVTGSYLTIFTGSLSGSYGNVTISGSAYKQGCGTCQTASLYTTVVAAGTFDSTASQADANNKTLVYLTSVSQSNANTFGSCSISYYYNSQISNSIRKNNCTTCQTGSLVTYTLPVSQSQYTSTCSYAEAQNNAYAYYNSTSQSYANTNGTCTTNYYYNTQLSASVQRNNCGPCGTGSFVLYTVPASSSMFTNTCSLSEAQTSASVYFAANSQSYANTYGTCSYTTYYSQPISASVQKNDCTGSLTGSYSWVSIPASQSNSTCSVSDANSKAQIYFNANSQSWANSSGYCYNKIGILTFTNSKLDINNATTASIFPLTGSLLQSASTNPPNVNDSKWYAAVWFSQSYAMPANTYPSQNVGVISGSSETIWIKLTDKNGNLVNTNGYDTTGNSFMIQDAYTNLVFGGSRYGIDASRIFTNRMTSSVATNSIQVQFKNSSVSKTVTASVYYSTSSNDWPNFTSSQWDLLGYTYSSSYTTVDREYQFPAFYSGSATMSRQESYLPWSATPTYLYIKFQSGSTPVGFGGAAQYTSSNGTTYSSSISGSGIYTMAQLYISAPTSSDKNTIGIYLNAP